MVSQDGAPKQKGKIRFKARRFDSRPITGAHKDCERQVDAFPDLKEAHTDLLGEPDELETREQTRASD